MDFEAALGALLAMVGRRVGVATHLAEEGVMLTTFAGVLRQGHDIGLPVGMRREDENEVFYFFMVHDVATGFFLSGRDFNRATWNSDRSVLSLEIGPVVLTIDGSKESDPPPAQIGDAG